MSAAFIYRLVIAYPEGSREPGWRPAGWPDPGTIPVRDRLRSRKTRRYRKQMQARGFRWPRERLYLSSSSAYERAWLLRSYGAEVWVQRSYPVDWPDLWFTDDTEITDRGNSSALMEYDASGLPRWEPGEQAARLHLAMLGVTTGQIVWIGDAKADNSPWSPASAPAEDSR